MNQSKQNKGFTLVELVVVMAILGLLSTVGLQSFRINRSKTRDAQRKSDLEQVQRALEMYHSDHNDYPAATNGRISGISWGGEFKDLDVTNGAVYMKELPQDPSGISYCYQYIASPISYRVYAKLENTESPGYGGPYSCGTLTNYNYAVVSSNIAKPTATP